MSILTKWKKSICIVNIKDYRIIPFCTMSFENRREKVIPLKHFVFRLGRYGIFAFGLIVFSVLLGTFGYHYIAQLNWMDSFHMSCMILTGMGPVNEITTTSGKVFSSLYALYSGIAFLSILAVFFSPLVHRLLHILHVENPPSDS